MEIDIERNKCSYDMYRVWIDPTLNSSHIRRRSPTPPNPYTCICALDIYIMVITVDTVIHE